MSEERDVRHQKIWIEGAADVDGSGFTCYGEWTSKESASYPDAYVPADAIQSAVAEEREKQRVVDIVFDGPPSHVAPRFVECESPPGVGISVGEWVERDDGYWVLRLTAAIRKDTEG